MGVIAFLVVAWAPGAVIFRLPLLQRDRRAALPPEERVYWAAIIGSSVSLSLVLALAALHRYSFSRLLIADLAIALVLAAGARFDLRLGPSRGRAGLTLCIPIVARAVVGVAVPSAVGVHHRRQGPGRLLNAGVQIAQRGALVARDPTVAAVPAFARDLFFPPDRNKDYYLSVRFMGFFVLDPDTGAVVSQFPHVFPASVAIGYGLDGLTGARRAVSFWAVMGRPRRVFRGRATVRAAGRRGGRGAARPQRRPGVVRAIPERRSRDADAALRGAAGQRAGARGRRSLLRAGGGTAVRPSPLPRFDAVIAIAAVVLALALGRVGGTGARAGRSGRRSPPAAALAGWYLLGSCGLTSICRSHFSSVCRGGFPSR